MGSALNTFNDFVNVTGPTWMTSATDVINEAQKNNYLLRRFLKANANHPRIIQGGRRIQDTILFDESNSFQFYHPNEVFSWQNPQVLENWAIDWRFAVDHMSWTDQEIELQINPGMTRDARWQVYKKLKYTKEQRLWTSILNGMEDHLFAVPETADMEAEAGKQPYSIPAFVNENTNGLFYSGATPTGKTAWTTVESIDPTVETRWVPQVATYSVSTAIAPHADNVIAAFDEMFYKVRFESPPTKQEYFEQPKLYAQFIACSRRGINVYQQLLRASNDTLVFNSASRQDPAYHKPQYAGIDLEYVATLNDALLYANNTSTSAYVSELDSNAAADGPRYYWLNGEYISPVFHTTRYMMKKMVREHPNQPFTHVAPVDTWYNLVCRSRQRQGIVVPTGSVYTS